MSKPPPCLADGCTIGASRYQFDRDTHTRRECTPRRLLEALGGIQGGPPRCGAVASQIAGPRRDLLPNRSPSFRPTPSGPSGWQRPPEVSTVGHSLRRPATVERVADNREPRQLRRRARFPSRRVAAPSGSPPRWGRYPAKAQMVLHRAEHGRHQRRASALSHLVTGQPVGRGRPTSPARSRRRPPKRPPASVGGRPRPRQSGTGTRRAGLSRGPSCRESTASPPVSPASRSHWRRRGPSAPPPTLPPPWW